MLDLDQSCVPSDHLALCPSSGGSRGELWGCNPPLNFHKVRSPAWPCDRFSCRIIYVDQGWIPRRIVSAYDVINASYLPTTINIYDLEIRSINNYRKSYDIASFLVSTNISRRCRFGNSKPCKYIRSSYVRRNCIYDNNWVSANISSYDYR